MNDASLRHLRVLFGGGGGAGLTDGQLLQRFAARDGLRSERAFAVLVERHGPMVLRVARSVLRDPDLADDAFQDAFLALARRARSLWVRDSIGPWLHAVTVRTSTRMRADRARRRRIDEEAASLAPDSFEPGVPDDLGAALHEEIARLPDRQRQAVVLCLVEGLTHDEAARRLDWPVGTVRSRLARGRERLKGRLERRGLAPSSGLLIGPGLLGRSGIEAVRGALVSATVQSAVSATQGGLIGLVGTVPAGAIAATFTLMKESAMIHRVSAAFGLLAAGVLAVGVSIPAQSKPQPAPVPEASQPSDEANSVVRDYPVRDLVKSTHQTVIAQTIENERGGTSRTIIPVSNGDYRPLMELLTETVAPGTWTIRDPKVMLRDEAYDPKMPDTSITVDHQDASLIVRHSEEVHEQIAERLRQIRRMINAMNTASEARRTQTMEQFLQQSEQEFLEEVVPGRVDTQEAEVIEERIIGPNPDANAQFPNRYVVERRLDPIPVPSRTRYVYERPANFSEKNGQEWGSKVVERDHPTEPSPPDVVRNPEEEIIVPEPTKDEIIEERIIGPEPSRSERVSPPSTRLQEVETEPASTRHRIDALERKLDAILDELRAIRGTDHRENENGNLSGLLP